MHHVEARAVVTKGAGQINAGAPMQIMAPANIQLTRREASLLQLLYCAQHFNAAVWGPFAATATAGRPFIFEDIFSCSIVSPSHNSFKLHNLPGESDAAVGIVVFGGWSAANVLSFGSAGATNILTKATLRALAGSEAEGLSNDRQLCQSDAAAL
jgi:hypothetical protein